MSKPKEKKCVATLSVLPADGEIDIEVMRQKVKSVERDGLIWGEGQIEPFVFGLQKLVIGACFVMDKVNINDIVDLLESEEYSTWVQSVSIDDTTEV